MHRRSPIMRSISSRIRPRASTIGSAETRRSASIGLAGHIATSAKPLRSGSDSTIWASGWGVAAAITATRSELLRGSTEAIVVVID